MKKLGLALISISLAVPAFAGQSYTLDRNGVFWRLESDAQGTVLIGTKDGREIARSTVPFPLGIAGQNDASLQLVADELTGKVILAWQRNWADTLSEIMLAVWKENQWERIERLTPQLESNPRNPVLKLARVSSTSQDPVNPEDRVTVTESFALVAWYQGSLDSGEIYLAALRLPASPEEDEALTIHKVDSSPHLGLNCPQPLSQETVERPEFASEPPGPVSHLLVASPTTCLLLIHEIRFEFRERKDQEASRGPLVQAMRRRHTPIFGVRRMLPVPQGIGVQGARVILGADLQPVLYRVVPGAITYMLADQNGWSELRTLPLGDGLQLPEAIALVENLAR